MFLPVRFSMVSPVASSRWSGGMPPAPAGQMGIMVSFLLVLHWQGGDGLVAVHSELWKMFSTTAETSGRCHSDVLLPQVILEGKVGNIYEYMKHMRL